MQQFDIIKTPLSGLILITHKPIEDTRGTFERIFCAEELTQVGWNYPIVQINKTLTKKSGTVRGMHYQLPPHAEYKFVTCLTGRVLDVVIDLRKNSATFLKTYSIELSPEQKQSLIIPEGFAHGFQTLTDDVEMLYLHSSAYSPDSEGTVNPEDPTIGIKWPLLISDLSDKDKKAGFLAADFAGIEL